MKLHPTLVVLVAATLIAGGCGDEKESPQSEAAPEVAAQTPPTSSPQDAPAQQDAEANKAATSYSADGKVVSRGAFDKCIAKQGLSRNTGGTVPGSSRAREGLKMKRATYQGFI